MDLSLEDPHLVAQDKDLEVLVGIGPSPADEQFQKPVQAEVHQGEGHDVDRGIRIPTKASQRRRELLTSRAAGLRAHCLVNRPIGILVPFTRIISREELQAAIDREEVTVVEALPRSYYAQEHIPGARNLPLDELEVLARRILPDKTAPIVTYCSNTACANSKTAAQRLERLGYTDVSAYEAGKQDWIDAGLPVETGADALEAGAVR